jgi:hypothetical protein
LEQGLLTYTLLAGLRAVDRGPLSDQCVRPASEDRVAHVLEWFSFAASHSPRLAGEYFGQQQDVQLGGSGGTSFPVLPIPVGADAPAAAPPQLATGERPLTRPQQSPGVASRLSPAIDRPRLHLVAVGVNRYAEQAMSLKFARPDAQAMTALFRRRGPMLYREVLITELLDEQATRPGILSALDNAARLARPEDVFVMFLAGHGTMVGQRYYVIPHEFRRQADSLEVDIREQGLAVDVLGDALAKVPASRRVLIFDTCASGGALSISGQGRDPFAFAGAIAKLGQRQGVFAIAAAAAGAEAQEVEALGHGVLTYALLAGLRAVTSGPLEGQGIAATRPDGVIDVLEWLSFAAGQVPRLTKQYLGSQQDVQTSGQGTSFGMVPAWEPPKGR